MTDKEKLDRFRDISRRYSDTSILMHEAIARKAGLSGTDHKYLGLLIQNGPMTAGELAKATGLTTGAVTGLIDRLEKKNLVNRLFDKHDRRKVIIVPNSESALKLLAPLFADLQEKTAALVLSFSEPELLAVERYFISATGIMHDILTQFNTKEN